MVLFQNTNINIKTNKKLNSTAPLTPKTFAHFTESVSLVNLSWDASGDPPNVWQQISV